MKLFLIAVLIACTQAFDGYLPIEEKLRADPENYPLFQALPTAVLDRGGRIVGGNVSDVGQFPWQVALFLNTTAGNFFCGGVILDNNTVATAAHCVEDLRSVDVVTGAWNISRAESTQREYTVNASFVRRHEAYNSRTLVNDIALINITNGLVLDGYAQAVSLPRKSQNGTNLTGQNATTSGWGRDSDNSTTISDILRFVVTPIISNQVCGQTFSITDDMICGSGASGKGSCNGDSGGPYVTNLNKTLVGLVSFGAAAGCEAGYPHVYTRVTSFISWIETHSSVRFPA